MHFSVLMEYIHFARLTDKLIACCLIYKIALFYMKYSDILLRLLFILCKIHSGVHVVAVKANIISHVIIFNAYKPKVYMGSMDPCNPCNPCNP